MEEYLNYGASNQSSESVDQSSQELTVTNSIKENLMTTSKWTMFLSIVSFVFIGLMVIGGIFVSSLGSVLDQYADSQVLPFSRFPLLLGILYVIMAAIVFFPTFYLYQFSSKTKSALNSNDQQQLDDGIRYAKKYAKFNGILMIIVISFYLLVIPIGIIAGVASQL